MNDRREMKFSLVNRIGRKSSVWWVKKDERFDLGGDPSAENADNFFYMKSIENKIPSFRLTVNGEVFSGDLISFFYEEGSEYYKKLIYPSRKKIVIQSTTLLNKRDEVVVEIFYEGNSSENPLIFYNANDKALIFSGRITKRKSVPRSKNNPLRVYEYEMEETSLSKLDFRISYERGDSVIKTLQKVPLISRVVLPISKITFKTTKKNQTLLTILKDLEEYLRYRDNLGVLFFNHNVLQWKRQESFLELTGEDVVNDITITMMRTPLKLVTLEKTNSLMGSFLRFQWQETQRAVIVIYFRELLLMTRSLLIAILAR